MFQPIIFKHSVREKFNEERLNRIVRSSMEQSERKYAMRLGRPVSLEDYLRFARPRGVFGHVVSGVEETRRDAAPSKVVVERHKGMCYIRNETTIIIGPEGGFCESEIDMMQKQFVRPMSFSDAILRVETAAIAGISILKKNNA